MEAAEKKEEEEEEAFLHGLSFFRSSRKVERTSALAAQPDGRRQCRPTSILEVHKEGQCGQNWAGPSGPVH